MHLCLATYFSFQYLFLILHGYGYHTAMVKNLVWSACPGIAKLALAAQDMALIIMTTSQEMLQKNLFGSERYPYDLVRYFYTP